MGYRAQTTTTAPSAKRRASCAGASATTGGLAADRVVMLAGLAAGLVVRVGIDLEAEGSEGRR